MRVPPVADEPPVAAPPVVVVPPVAIVPPVAAVPPVETLPPVVTVPPVLMVPPVLAPPVEVTPPVAQESGPPSTLLLLQVEGGVPLQPNSNEHNPPKASVRKCRCLTRVISPETEKLGCVIAVTLCALVREFAVEHPPSTRSFEVMRQCDIAYQTSILVSIIQTE